MISKIKGINGGKNNSLNVYAQLNEPTKKDGIWIETKEVNVNKPKYNANIPYDFDGSAVSIGTYIYLLGGYKNRNAIYRYNTLTDKYIKLRDIPYEFYSGSAVAIETDIYLFGSENSSYKKYAYKYNTLTNTLTQLANIPYYFSYGCVIAIGTDIYLMGSINDTTAYKYDTLTNTYTRLSNIPYQFYGCAVTMGTYIYLFGSGFSSELNKNTYKYDTLTDTYTKLTNTPYNFSKGDAIVIDNDIYLFGGESLSVLYRAVCKYDTLTNTYIGLTDTPYDFYNSSAIIVNSDIYLLGGNYNNNMKINYTYLHYISLPAINKYKYNKILIKQSVPTTLENGNIYAIYGSTYATKLLEQLILNFKEIYLYKDNETQPYPIYYGNGTEWIKILN